MADAVRDATLMVLDAIFVLFIIMALVRFWMQAFRAPVFNPPGQFAIALTDWAVKPLRRVIPGVFKLDWSSLVVAGLMEYILDVLTLVIIKGTSSFDHPEVLSILLFFAFVKLVRYSIYVFMGALIILVVLSWVAPRQHPAMPFFDGLTRPFTRPARRVIPPIGGIDISPIFVLLFFQILLMIPVAWFEMAAKNMIDRALP